MADQIGPVRHSYHHGDRLIYEWDQTVTEVNVYTKLPPGVRARDLQVDITASRLSFGLKGNPPFLAHDLAGTCRPSESLWTIEDGELHFTLSKQTKAEAWPSAFKGHALDFAKAEEEKKRLMLERFQLENPGFDFSGADFNGAVPDPASFMGGMRTTR